MEASLFRDALRMQIPGRVICKSQWVRNLNRAADFYMPKAEK